MTYLGNLLDDLQELVNYRIDDHSIAGEAIAEIKKLRTALEGARVKTLKCFHCCDSFPAVDALQFGDKVFCSKECSKLYVKVEYYK